MGGFSGRLRWQASSYIGFEYNAAPCRSWLASEVAGTNTVNIQPRTKLRTAEISGTSRRFIYTRNGSVMLIRSSMF